MLEGLCVDLERQWFMGSNVINLSPLVLVGPAGVGKTAIAHEIAKVLGVYVREANVGGSPDAHISDSLPVGVRRMPGLSQKLWELPKR
mgnify:CR=1 FL=1